MDQHRFARYDQPADVPMVLRGLRDPSGVVHLPIDDAWTTRLTVCERHVFFDDQWRAQSLFPSNEPITCLFCSTWVGKGPI